MFILLIWSVVFDKRKVALEGSVVADVVGRMCT